MRMLFIEYPTCSTCRKAKEYLQDAGMELEIRHIVEETPTVEELRAWVKQSGLELKKFFNTSGNVYKEEQLNLLAGNGMLIKRPLLICEKGIAVGFKEEKYKNLCSE
ncbi:arsenate reductase family protein [[Clostridium] innocuum]|uniref:ArsC/Spx/MgsR family protein n=1 Tax=Clostridium innocuum TaxID=1522 RepID=UPI001F05ECD0|nr:ArsC/Spx/MgsR family protein [[Clostridium] innocuum]MCH1953875.1 arsenate reductase family protein [[Clostridium] innocuum]